MPEPITPEEPSPLKPDPAEEWEVWEGNEKRILYVKEGGVWRHREKEE